MEKLDYNFFPRLNEAYKIPEDKEVSEKIEGRNYNLFTEIGMTDANYFEKYPTVYHLRKELVENKEKADLRLVYLAIHHIIKYRGNFLFEGEFKNSSENIKIDLENIILFLNEKEIFLKTNKEEIINILCEKNISRTYRKEKMVKCFDFDKDDKTVIENVANAIVGNVFKLDKIFDLDEEIKISFLKEIENEESIIAKLGENENIYISLKSLYSWYTSQDV